MREKNKKPVLFLTSKQVIEPVQEGGKPEIVKYYNRTKGGVDSGDQRTRNTTVARRTPVWSKKIFGEMIDIACLNAFIIYEESHPKWESGNPNRHAEFLRILAEELSVGQMRDRLAVGHLPQDVNDGITAFLRTHKQCAPCGSNEAVKCQLCTEQFCCNHRKSITLVVCKQCAEQSNLIIVSIKQSNLRKLCQKCTKHKPFRTTSTCCACKNFVCLALKNKNSEVKLTKR